MFSCPETVERQLFEKEQQTEATKHYTSDWPSQCQEASDARLDLGKKDYGKNAQKLVHGKMVHAK